MNEMWGWWLAGSAALGSVFYAARNTLLMLWQYLESIVIVQIDLTKFQGHVPDYAVQRWLKSKGKLLKRVHLPFRVTTVRVSEEYLEREPRLTEGFADGRYFPVSYQGVESPSIWWLGGLRVMWLSGRTPGSPLSASSSRNEDPSNGISCVSFVRGTFNPVQLVNELLRYSVTLYSDMSRLSRFAIHYKTGNYGRYRQVVQSDATHACDSSNPPVSSPPPKGGGNSVDQYANVVYSFDELGVAPLSIDQKYLSRELSYGSRLHDIWLNDNAKSMLQELRFWLGARQWFRSRGVPWKRGYGLVGSPGNGKTATIRAIAAELGVPVFLFDLSTFSNAELVDEWHNIVRNVAPCFCVLEDLDRVFHGSRAREGVGLSFDCILNLLDGAEQAAGVVVFVTSNHPEELDEALMKKMPDGSYVTRPGRIDSVITFDAPLAEGREHIARRIMKGFESQIPDLVEKGEGDSGAEFQLRCCREAEKLYWATLTDGVDEVDQDECCVSVNA